MTSVPLQLMRKREWTEGNVADGHRPSDINRRGTRDPERQPNGNACPDQLHVDPPTSRDLIVAHPKRDAASAVSLPGGRLHFHGGIELCTATPAGHLRMRFNRATNWARGLTTRARERCARGKPAPCVGSAAHSARASRAARCSTC